ncbi:hypothetical protein HRF87_05730 [Bacillus sp. CRN 9]|nr:hypothetical protein [Bacillus sp. CRN 9]
MESKLRKSLLAVLFISVVSLIFRMSLLKVSRKSQKELARKSKGKEMKTRRNRGGK